MKSEKIINIFSKDFDLCPDLITNYLSIIIYYKLIDSNNEKSKIVNEKICQPNYSFGTIFTFPNFLEYLIRIASLNYGENIKLVEKMILLFEKMNLSFGFRNIERKTFTTHNKKTFLAIDDLALIKVLLLNIFLFIFYKNFINFILFI